MGGGAFKRTSLPIREINKVHTFIYLFNENCWGCSWPQPIPLLSTPRTDTHIYHAGVFSLVRLRHVLLVNPVIVPGCWVTKTLGIL